MEEEKLSERHNSLWALLDISYTYKHFLGKFFSRKSTNFFGNLKLSPIFNLRNFVYKKNKLGFTLVELLIVLAILGIFVGFVLAMLNPLAQLQKSRDAQRQNDIKQLQTALDLFYNDNNCYPKASSQILTTSDLPSQYIRKLPTDPSGGSYYYLRDSSDCPQWNVLFARLSLKPQAFTACPLSKLNEVQACVPQNFDSEHDFCIISGEVNCDVISQYILPVIVTPPANQTSTPTPIVTPTSTPIVTPTPIATPTLTPTPTPIPPYICTGLFYAYTSGSICNELSNPTDCDFIQGGLDRVCYQNRSGETCLSPICTAYQP